MSDFWIPEDVKHHWAALLPEFERQAKEYGSCQLAIGLHVRDGDIVAMAEMEAKVIEPNGWTSNGSRPWWSVIRRMQSVGSNLRGEAIISIRVILNARGGPVCWTAPEIMRLEPKKRV